MVSEQRWYLVITMPVTIEHIPVYLENMQDKSVGLQSSHWEIGTWQRGTKLGENFG